jgi:hypothetical protein
MIFFNSRHNTDKYLYGIENTRLFRVVVASLHLFELHYSVLLVAYSHNRALDIKVKDFFWGEY